MPLQRRSEQTVRFQPRVDTRKNGAPLCKADTTPPGGGNLRGVFFCPKVGYGDGMTNARKPPARKGRSVATHGKASARLGTCEATGKIIYRDSGDAEFAATAIVAKSGGKPLHPYACLKCGRYHLTRKPNWRLQFPD